MISCCWGAAGVGMSWDQGVSEAGRVSTWGTQPGEQEERAARALAGPTLGRHKAGHRQCQCASPWEHPHRPLSHPNCVLVG